MALSPQIVWQSTLPRRFGIILEKILDRQERSGIAVQLNGGGGGGLSSYIVYHRHCFIVPVHLCNYFRVHLIFYCIMCRNSYFIMVCTVISEKNGLKRSVTFFYECTKHMLRLKNKINYNGR